MLLTVDIGNTNITIGVFHGDVLEATFRMTTKIQRTSDEFGVMLYELLRSRKLQKMNWYMELCLGCRIIFQLDFY